MCLLNGDPFVLWHSLADVQLIAFHAIFALYHRAGVQRIAQNAANRAVRPQIVQLVRGRMAVVHALLPLVGGWIRNALSIQLFGNTEYARSGEKPVENVADNGGSRFVNQQTAVVIRVFAVAVGCERADKFALSALQIK